MKDISLNNVLQDNFRTSHPTFQDFYGNGIHATGNY